MNGRKIKKVNNDTSSNKTFEDKRKSKKMAIDKVKDIRRRQTGDQQSIQENSMFKENINDANFELEDPSTIQALPGKKVRSVKHEQEYDVNMEYPHFGKKEQNHNFVGGNKAALKNNTNHNVRSLRDKRESPSMGVKPFELEPSSYQNMLNALNVSGVENDETGELVPGNGYDMKYSTNDRVNDELIEDIQKRLELLDEFK